MLSSYAVIFSYLSAITSRNKTFVLYPVSIQCTAAGLKRTHNVNWKTASGNAIPNNESYVIETVRRYVYD